MNSLVAFILFFKSMSVGLHVCLCTMCVQYPLRSEEGIGYLGTGVTDSYEPLYGCWELNLGSLQEQQVILMDKLSL